MSTPLGDIHRPEAERFKKGRKVYLVPLFVFPETPPVAEEQDQPESKGPTIQEKVARYWEEVHTHISKLEVALGPVNRLYHEAVFLEGEEGAKMVDQLNPRGYALFSSRFASGAHVEATEDRPLLEESSDWQRCLYVGVVSEKVSSTIFQAYTEVTAKRYEYIASQIDSTLKEDQSSILVISDNHRVQFPADIQVFYVAPPSLNDLRRWLDDRMKARPEPEPELADEDTQPIS